MSFSVSAPILIDRLHQPEDAASVPAHQDTSEDDEPDLPAPVPATITTAARIKSPLVARPPYGARSAQVVQQDAESSGKEDDEEEEEEDTKPPPKKKVRKSEHAAAAPVPVMTKEKEKEKEKPKKERRKREKQN